MPRHNQQALDFSGNVQPRAPGSPTPLLPRETLPKRPRAPENDAIDARGSQSPTPEVEGEELWRVDPLHGWDEYIATLPIQPIAMNDEVARWLKEPVISREATPEAQRLYMLSKAFDFPIITQMARDYHAIPATSAPSERVFSMAGNLISKKRTRISSENVRYVLCLRSWGLLEDDDDEDEIIISEDGKIVQVLLE